LGYASRSHVFSCRRRV